MAGISHRESREIVVVSEQMFDLVADVERYPEFVPLLRAAKVIRHHPDGYETDQTLALGPLTHRFRTRTALDRPRSIVVTSADPSFRRFDLRWSFTPTTADCCRIDFSLDCEVRSLWLRPVGDVLMTQMALTMVNAFVTRAHRVASDQDRLNG